MGLSVRSQCDEKQYFSISRIDKEQMKLAGLDMTVTELREKARGTVPFAEIITGDVNYSGKCRRTKIYRYADFATKSG